MNIRKEDITNLKEALEKLLAAAHPAYVTDSYFREKLIAARDNAIKVLEEHSIGMQGHIADDGEMYSLRGQFAIGAIPFVMTAGGVDITFLRMYNITIETNN